MSVSWDKSVKIWSVVNKKLVHEIKDAHADRIWTLTLSKDSRLIITGGKDKTLKVWDFNSHELLWNVEGAHDHSIRSINTTFDSNYVITGSSDFSNQGLGS